jgi:hypothetical protein
MWAFYGLSIILLDDYFPLLSNTDRKGGFFVFQKLNLAIIKVLKITVYSDERKIE